MGKRLFCAEICSLVTDRMWFPYPTELPVAYPEDRHHNSQNNDKLWKIEAPGHFPHPCSNFQLFGAANKCSPGSWGPHHQRARGTSGNGFADGRSQYRVAPWKRIHANVGHRSGNLGLSALISCKPWNCVYITDINFIHLGLTIANQTISPRQKESFLVT